VVEQPEGAAVGGRDHAADQKRVAAAVARREGDEAVVDQGAVILAARLADRPVGLAERLRLPRRNDDDVVGAERDPVPVPGAHAAGACQDVVDRDRVEGVEGKPPPFLDLANRKGVQTHRQRDEQPVEDVGGRHRCLTKPKNVRLRRRPPSERDRPCARAA
jgi:hypothetical protein